MSTFAPAKGRLTAGAETIIMVIASSVFNTFMNTAISENGTIAVKTPLSGAGDYIELKARMDLIISAAACSAGRCNDFRCTAVDIEI